jgi:hypothetical protein
MSDVPRLEAASLFQEENKRDKLRCEIYNTILSQVHNKIKTTNKIAGNAQQLIYVVPEFIPGVPRFDMKACIIYLAYNLRASGFIVNYTHPNILFISWKEHARNYRINESPYTKTLIQVTEESIKQQFVAQTINEKDKPKKSNIRKVTEYKNLSFNDSSGQGQTQGQGQGQGQTQGPDESKTVTFI